MKPKHWICVGAISAAIAVALGAIGAHGLDGWLTKTFEPEEAAKRLETWQTAAHYHRFHAIGLIVIGLLLQSQNQRWLHMAGYFMLVGTALFSGLLYVYSITGSRWMGPIFPIGGFSYILGWVMLALGAWRR